MAAVHTEAPPQLNVDLGARRNTPSVEDHTTIGTVNHLNPDPNVPQVNILLPTTPSIRLNSLHPSSFTTPQTIFELGLSESSIEVGSHHSPKPMDASGSHNQFIPDLDDISHPQSELSVPRSTVTVTLDQGLRHRTTVGVFASAVPAFGVKIKDAPQRKEFFECTVDVVVIMISVVLLVAIIACVVGSQEPWPVYKSKIILSSVFVIASFFIFGSPFFATPHLTIIVLASISLNPRVRMWHRGQRVCPDSLRDPGVSNSEADCRKVTQANYQQESPINATVMPIFHRKNGPTPGPLQPFESYVPDGCILTLSSQDAHLVELDGTAPVSLGGSCDLFTGIHRPTMTRLAMKAPRFTAETAEDTLRRSKREASIWSQLRHPNILPFLGVIEKGSQFYLVSPLLPRGDLLTFVQNRHEVPPEESGKPVGRNANSSSSFSELQAVRGIAAGLEYLHCHNVVHGDLKARNVLLSDNDCVQICDFGLTKLPDHAITSTELRGVGSTRWQSPELLDNKSKTGESDVYAFGMTIAEILTGNYPFPHLITQSAVVAAIVLRNERPPFDPLSRLGIDYQPLWSVAAKCWARPSADRPTMKQVLEELQWVSG